jgi:hypothetical protein
LNPLLGKRGNSNSKVVSNNIANHTGDKTPTKTATCNRNNTETAASRRKKKKPSSFIPPPNPAINDMSQQEDGHQRNAIAHTSASQSHRDHPLDLKDKTAINSVSNHGRQDPQEETMEDSKESSSSLSKAVITRKVTSFTRVKKTPSSSSNDNNTFGTNTDKDKSFPTSHTATSSQSGPLLSLKRHHHQGKANNKKENNINNDSGEKSMCNNEKEKKNFSEEKKEREGKDLSSPASTSSTFMNKSIGSNSSSLDPSHHPLSNNTVSSLPSSANNSTNGHSSSLLAPHLDDPDSLSGPVNAITNKQSTKEKQNHVMQLNHIQPSSHQLQQQKQANNFQKNLSPDLNAIVCSGIVPSKFNQGYPSNIQPLALPTRKLQVSSGILSSLFQATNSIHNKIASTGIGMMRGESNFHTSNRPQVQSARLFESRREDHLVSGRMSTTQLLSERHSCNLWSQGHHNHHHIHNNMMFRSAMSQGHLNQNLTTRLTPVHTIVHSTAPSAFLKNLPPNTNPVDKVVAINENNHNSRRESHEANLDIIQEQLNHHHGPRHEDQKMYSINDPEHNRMLIKQKLQEKRERESNGLHSIRSMNRSNHHQVMGRSSVPVGRVDMNLMTLSNENGNLHVPSNRPQIVHPIPVPAQVFGGYKSIVQSNQYNHRKHHPRRSRSSSRVNTVDMVYDYPPKFIVEQHSKLIDTNSRSHGNLVNGNIGYVGQQSGFFTPHIETSQYHSDNDDYGMNKSQHFYYEANDMSFQRNPKTEDKHQYSMIKAGVDSSTEEVVKSIDHSVSGGAGRKSRRDMEMCAEVSLSVPCIKRSRNPIRLSSIGNISPPPQLVNSKTTTAHHLRNMSGDDADVDSDNK